MVSNKIYLFGVYPVDNPYFMTNKFTTDSDLLLVHFGCY